MAPPNTNTDATYSNPSFETLLGEWPEKLVFASTLGLNAKCPP